MRIIASTLLLVLVGCQSSSSRTAKSSSDSSTVLADSAFTSWVRANAVPLRPVDEPYVDSSFAFLGKLAGDARILALGEPIHGGHEPLAFRNEAIRYAVTHLGFTAVVIESGFTESEIVDRYIQGGPGNVDSVIHNGITWGFQTLEENKQLALWLREYNARAKEKVHFFGIDLTGGEDIGTWPGAARSVMAAVNYLTVVSPAAGADL